MFLFGFKVTLCEWRPRTEAATKESDKTAATRLAENGVDWIRLRTILLKALMPFQEARAAVVKALEEADAMEADST